MLQQFPIAVTFTEIDHDKIPDDVTSAIGHADTARVVGNILGKEIPCNRISIQLTDSDELYIAQMIGPRLPEGATELPPGATIKFYRINLTKPCVSNDGSPCECVTPCYVNCNRLC